MTTRVPIGRQAELSRVDGFLEAVPRGAIAVAITGPAGIGKTTIWREGVLRARQRGYRVLSARPAGAETRLSFSGLADLMEMLPDDVFEALPAVQHEALDVALLRRAAEPAGHGPRAVATAVLSVLRDLTATVSVLIAVEDAQWLDAATAEALSFALRRLEDLPVGTLVSVRTDGTLPQTFEQALPSERRSELPLGPLSTAAIHDVIERELGQSLARPVVVKIAAASSGNAMYAVEIAREMDRTGIPAPGVALHVPDQLRTLMRARIARLPARTRAALLVTACLSQPDVSLVDGAALAAAEDEGIVVVDQHGRIAFTHPLLASAVYESASVAKRRSVHRDLAARMADSEERARHLGLAAAVPDDAIAAELDRAAEHAAARGAMAAACELSRRALQMTQDPRGTDAVMRTLVLARHLIDVGQTLEATKLLEGALEFDLTGDLRAEVLFRLGEMSWYERDFDGGYARLVEALRLARDRTLVARIHNQAAWISEPIDLARAIRHEDAVLELLEPGRGPYAYALMYRAYLRLINGEGADRAAVERGTRMGPPEDRDDASPVPMVWAMFMDDFNAARARLEAAVAESAASGEETSLQTFLGHLAAIECWTGNWARADVCAARAVELTERISSSAYLGSALFARGYVDAHLGRIEEARAAGQSIVALFDSHAEGQLVLGHWLLGFAALVVQDHAAADRELGLAAQILERLGQCEPVRFRFHPDQAEVAIGLGDFDRAEALIARLDERGRAFPRPWILATTARARGLLASGRGDLDAALADMHVAMGHHGDLDMPFERARTMLAMGQVLRRRREKSAARSMLTDALVEFERLGAPHWAQRAVAELARVPVRRSSPTLSATEQEIARLAASGLTNRQIAERAFVSVKTVEANIARIYRKLDIRSRAELGRAMADQEPKVET